MNKTKEELIIELSELQQRLKVITPANTKYLSSKKVLESDGHYRFLFESNPQPMWIYDSETLSFLEINDAAINHYGYSRDEFLSMTIKDIRPKEDREALKKDIELTQKDYNLAGDWRHLKKNGEIIFVEIISYAITVNNRKARHIMVNDITAQKRAIDDRTEALMLYNALINQAGDAFFVHDFDGKFIEVNQQACDSLGYSKEELLKLSVGDVEMDFDLNNAKKEWAKVESCNKFTFFGNHTHKNGNVFPVELRFGCADWKGQKLFLGLARDISHRIKAEEKLRESNAFLQISKEKTKIGGWVRNLKKKEVYWSDGITDILEMPLGYKPHLNEAIGFYTPEWREKITEVLTNCEQKGIPFDEDMEIITAKGKQVWVRVVGEADRDDDGIIVRINGTFQDISERKLAENQLQKLSTAVEQNPVSILLTDLEGNIEYVNPKVIEITGYSLEELIGKNPKIFSAGITPKSVYKKFWTTISSGKEWRGEFHNKRKNGEFYWELASISPIFNQKGKITNYLAVKEDITDRKEKEADLIIANEELAFQNEEKEKRAAELIIANKEMAFQNKEKEKRATELIVANKELIFQNEEKEKRASELIVANKELAFQNEEKEKRAAELIVANKELIFQNEEKEKRASELIIANEELAFQNEEKEKRASELIVANKELAFQNIEKEKRAAELIVANKELVFQNKEKEKRAAELNIAKERAEESDRLKSAFLANMSHEIRTPMNGILGFTDLLKEPDLSNEKQQKFIDVIQKSGARLLNIIDDILDISKIEAGLMTSNIKASNINEQIKYIYTFFKPEFKKKGLQLIVEKSTLEEDILIQTDSEKIYAIFTNLIKNALKFTNKGAVLFGYKRKGEYIEFYVKDTGIGIPKAKHEAVFERFIQADVSNNMAIQGAGLGLSITKGYVELLGGKIWVESEVENLAIGKPGGTTFYFTIPYITSPTIKTSNQTAKSSGKSGEQAGNLKILIAEDDEASALHLSILVEEFSSEILMAKNGIEAVEIYKNNPDIDLILMDMQLPKLNGYDATKQIRESNKDVIIIAQTAYALSGDRQKVMEAGCNDYIAKPIILDSFMALMQKYFKI